MPLLPAAAWLPATRRVETTVSVDGRTGKRDVFAAVNVDRFWG